MIELITGTPGAGKTLYAIAYINERAIKENRPVYYSGISGLTLPWIELDPQKWYECPPNSIIIIDECQRVFRPRSFGSDTPAYVERLETHRHLGLDLVFITQHPMLIDTNIRRLVGRHFHVSRRFGLKHASVLEYPSCKDQPLNKSADAVVHEFKYPAEVFEWYKSAEVHTHKARIPMRVWLLLALPIFIGAIGWFMYNRHIADKPEIAAALAGTSAPATSTSLSRRSSDRVATTDEYIKSLTPRIPGVLHTAAFYDKPTTPTRAPYPVGCIQTAASCKCYTIQGGVYMTDDNVCQQVLNDGFYRSWDEDKQERRDEK